MEEPIRSMPELVAALRKRRDDLQITHETLDAIAGWPAGYASKLLAPEPIKNLGWMSLGLGLNALGIALVVVEDPERIASVKGRWSKRERAQRMPILLAAPASRLGINPEIQITTELQEQMAKREHMRLIGKLGGKASAKRRMKTMGKRARQRAAAHAARIRWEKVAASRHV